MDPSRTTATAVGILLVAGMVLGAASSVPALERPEYLTALPLIENHVLMAAVLQFAMATVYVCMTGLTYPIVRMHSEGLALAYFGLRIVGAAFLFIGALMLLLLLSSAREFVASDQVGSLPIQAMAELLRVGRDLVNHLGMILPWSVGGLILSYSLLRTPLVPRWLAVWSVGGYTLTLAATLLLIVGAIEIVSPPYILMNAPTALMELVLAVYLVTRGFDRVTIRPVT